MIEAPLRQIRYRIRKEVYNQIFGTAYRVNAAITMISFIILVLLYLQSPMVPVALLNIKVEGPFEATSLAIAAIIMVLYNFFAWVEFTQDLNNQTRFNQLDSEMDRAKLLISELDQVCDFCTTLK